MTDKYLVHCSHCGFNFESDSARSDQQCPECDHRASSTEDPDESKHSLGIKTNYKGVPMDETDNQVP